MDFLVSVTEDVFFAMFSQIKPKQYFINAY